MRKSNDRIAGITVDTEMEVKPINLIPRSGNVILEEIPNPYVEGGEFATKSGIIGISTGKEGVERPHANLGLVIAVGENVKEYLRVGDRVWYNRVDTWPFNFNKRKLQIGKAKLLLGKYERIAE